MTSLTSVVAEASQQSDIIMTIHRGSFARGNGWVHCLFGQALACSATHKPRWSSLTNSLDTASGTAPGVEIVQVVRAASRAAH